MANSHDILAAQIDEFDKTIATAGDDILTSDLVTKRPGALRLHVALSVADTLKLVEKKSGVTKTLLLNGGTVLGADVLHTLTLTVLPNRAYNFTVGADGTKVQTMVGDLILGGVL